MTRSRPTGTIRPPAGSGSAVFVPLLAGLVAAVAVFGMLLFAEIKDRDDRIESENAASLELFQANMNALWERAAAVGGYAASRLGDADAARVAEVLGRYKAYWPEAGFSVYDRDGNLITLPGGENDPAPVAHLARDLVHKALVGQTGRDFALARGFLSLSAAVPVRGVEAKALVVSIPLDSFALESLKPLCKADLALLLVDEASGQALGDAGITANTFARSKDAAARAWPALGRDLQGVRLDAIRQIALADGLTAVAVPLSSASDVPLALLVAAPLRGVPLDWGAPWRMAVSLGSGLITALVAALLLKRRGRRMAEALAGAVAAMTGDAPDARGLWQNVAWPAPLASALESMAETLREYRVKAWNAERDRESGLRQTVESGTQGIDRERNFERLFGGMPVGAFQAERDGRFIRVNQSFAQLLGYDSPTALLVEHASFSEFFLYGDEFRSPLAVLAAQRGERHLVSLRRHDGKVRHFALLFSPATTADDDPAAILEGFLLDRSMDEKLTKATLERDFAKRQRSSLALLLAVTCTQTQGYLESESRELTGGGSEEEQAGLQERKVGMQSVKAILGDIYQIAMSEVEGAPPASVPLDLGRFLSKTCRQILPGLKDKGVSLRCEVAEELLTRLSGPAPLLRHALQRALITVTATAHGGWAWLSVVRDPNAPKSPGVTRILFSASWSAYSRDAGALPGGLDFEQFGGNNVVAFDAPADPEAVVSDSVPVGLELAGEQEVIRYLAQRMHGELVEGVFTNDVRSIQIIVPLDALAAGYAAARNAAPVPEGVAPAAPGEQPDGQPEDQAGGLPYERPAGQPGERPGDGGLGLEVSQPRTGDHDDMAAPLSADETAQPLELLVIDEGSDPLEAEAKGEAGLNILLVDDSLNNRLLFSLFLRETNHRITETHDGQEGVEAFQRGHFDVIFMDMEMPLMDGYQATRIIRALEADKGLAPTPIVGMTTYALPEFRRQCMLSGCSDFLTKPFTKTALFSLLDAFMQIKQDTAQPRE